VRRQFLLFLAAVQFLTRLPVPALSGFQPGWLAQSARYFPLVGVLVGTLNVLAWWLASRWLPAPVAVGLMLAVSLLITGAFHEDGFADTCDGMGGGTSIEGILAIMKDSRIGVYGAIGIFMMLGLKWATLVSLPAAAFALLVIGAHMISRWCSCGLIWGLRYVREEDSKSRPLANTLSAREWILSGSIGLLGLLPALAWLSSSAVLVCKSLGFALGAGAGAAAITALIAAAYFRRRIGGYTGDCLGAVQQLTELAFLLGGLALLTPARRVG